MMFGLVKTDVKNKIWSLKDKTLPLQYEITYSFSIIYSHL